MFKYELGARVRIVESGEQGTVTARAEYADCADQFQVAYRGADGVARLDWFFGSRLIPYQDGLQGPDPMAGVEVKAADVTRRMIDLVDGKLKSATGGGGGVDEALPAESSGSVGSDAAAFPPL